MDGWMDKITDGRTDSHRDYNAHLQVVQLYSTGTKCLAILPFAKIAQTVPLRQTKWLAGLQIRNI